MHIYYKKNGDIGKNFEDNDCIAKKLIILTINAYIKYKCLEHIHKPKEFSFYRRYQNHKGEEEEEDVFDRGIKGDSHNIQDKVEERILRENENDKKEENIGETYAKMLKRNIEEGLTVEEALEEMENALEINQEEILTILRTYMIKTKKVKETQDGGVVLGE